MTRPPVAAGAMRARGNARPAASADPAARPAVGDPMIAIPALPDAFTAQPCVTPDDAEIVAALIADCVGFDDGVREMTAKDICAYWNVPDLDLETSTLVVFERGRAVANAEVACD